MSEEWKPAPAAPRFKTQSGPEPQKPGEPRRPFRYNGGFSVSYRMDFPEGNSDNVNERRPPVSWQFIAIPLQRDRDLQRIEATIRRVIPEPDKETAALAYTEGDFSILLFTPKAVNLLWVLIQQHAGKECERPGPGLADRLVIGDPATWGDMVRPPPKRR